jgi:hypothetical protein
MQTRFVILHGWENRRPPEHWEHWLFDELNARGAEVDYPQLPDPDTPDLETWLGLLDELVTRGEGPVTLLAHSLAASLWLTRLARGDSPGLVTRLALAAIPAPAVLTSTVVEDFTDHPPRIAEGRGCGVRDRSVDPRRGHRERRPPHPRLRFRAVAAHPGVVAGRPRGAKLNV